MLSGECRRSRDSWRRVGPAVLALALGSTLATGSPAEAAGRATTLAVGCGSGVVVAQPATCTVVVTDSETAGTQSPPEGTVGLISDSGGTFLSPCELIEPTSNQSRCSVKYDPTEVGSGTHTITATYSEDPVHAGSSKSGTLTVGTAQRP